MKCPNCMIELRHLPNDELKCSECEFNTYPNLSKIDRFYVWLSVDKVTGNEGMIATPMGPQNIPMPAINAKLEMMMQFKPTMKVLAQRMGIQVRLVEFTRSETKEEVLG